MRALRDLTDGAEAGTFSYLLAQKIMAMEATITQLESTLIKVRRAIYGGDRFTENSCKNNVLDRGAHFDGFVLGADGKLIASGVDVKRGEFENITVGKNSNIFGSINAGEAWNIDGSDNDPNAGGSILLRKIPQSYWGDEVKIKNLKAYGITRVFGNISFENGYINFGSYSRGGYYIEGNYTATNLYNEIDAVVSGENVGGRVNLRGFIAYYLNGKYYPVNLIYLKRETGTYKYYIYGTDPDGKIVVILLNNSLVSFIDEIAGTEITRYSGSSYMKTRLSFV